MTVEEMKRRKKELGYSYETISRKSGVSLGTVQKIFGGYSRSPREVTLAKLSSVFEKDPALFSYNDPKRIAMLREGALTCQSKKQGEYTLEDYLLLPEERRVEMIDGVFYDMASPLGDHQLIAGQIYAMLLAYITRKKGQCIPFIAPMDVQLDCDEKTIVQPDVLVLCDRSKLNNKRIYGAPDLVVEVLSKSTKRKDSYLKLWKYKNAGVREYWMIDNKKKIVIVYEFRDNDEDLTTIYHFTDSVPVGIFDGDLKIDFSVIQSYVGFMDNILPE